MRPQKDREGLGISKAFPLRVAACKVAQKKSVFVVDYERHMGRMQLAVTGGDKRREAVPSHERKQRFAIVDTE